MSKQIIDADSDFSEDDDVYSGDEGYIDLVRSGPSNIHGSKTQAYSTSVTLGYIDDPEDESTTTYRDSRLGGQPVWLTGKDDKPVAPSAELVKCGTCSRKMALLVQVYAPLDDTEYDRVVYVFICKKVGCRRQKGSIKAVRGVKRDFAAEEAAKKQREEEEEKKAQESKKKQEVQMNLFSNSGSAASSNPFGGSGANPFAAASNPFEKKAETPAVSESTASAKPSFAEIAQKAAPAAAPKPVPTSADEDGEKAPAFSDSFYLDVETEVLDPMFHKRSLPAGLNPQDLVNLTIDPEDLEAATSGTAGASPSDSSKLEAAAAELAAAVPGGDDPSFQKFVDTVSQNPTQVVRYDVSGSVLPYSSRDAVYTTLTTANGIPVNPLTREPRRVELQVMPHAITVLEEADLAAIAASDEAQLKQVLTTGMDWGSIFVGTPLVDTMPGVEDPEGSGVAYCEEWVGVQYEQ